MRDKKTVFKVAGRIQNLPDLHTPEQRGDVIHDTRVTAAAQTRGRVPEGAGDTTESQDGGQNGTLLGKENGAPCWSREEDGRRREGPGSRFQGPDSRLQGPGPGPG